MWFVHCWKIEIELNYHNLQDNAYCRSSTISRGWNETLHGALHSKDRTVNVGNVLAKQEKTTMNATNTLKKLGIEKTFEYIYKDPDKNMPKIMDWADKFADGEFPTQREMIREAITNPEHPYYNFILHLPATFTAQDAGQQNTVTN